jgi:hypothetical protein
MRSDKQPQNLPATWCKCCDILLGGREQFVGHMIHSHEMPLGEAEMAWKSARDGMKCTLG